MCKFATRIVAEIKARELVEELLIDGIGQLESLEVRLNGTTYLSEFISLLAFIQHFANGGNPGNKVKYLKGNGGISEFEFRSKHLRIFAIQLPGKKIILYAGIKKASDSSDIISAFRAIKKEYLESLNFKHEKRAPNKK